MTLTALQLAGAFIVAHAICDYPLQGEFLALAKNHRKPIAGAPWYQALGAHASIHGGAVWLLTGLWWLGAMELVAHALIDYAKCDGKIGFNVDQGLHAACKGSYVLILMGLGLAS